MRVADQLDLFRQLRNVIVHNGTDLAEPVKATLVAIGEIQGHLEAPPRLAPTFIRRPVTCSPSDPIRKAARLMASEDFSQLPVYSERGRLLGTLSTAAVARWLGSHIELGVAALVTPVLEVMKHEEYPHAYLVFREDEKVGAALAAFKQSSDKGEPLYAIILTHDGHRDSSPRGIVTLSDVPRLWGLALGN